MVTTKFLKRRELYDLVWKHPLSHLAKSFAISPVWLAKICDDHDIPRPPRGYWAQIQFGQEIGQEPLPNPENEVEIEFTEVISQGLLGENPTPSAYDQAFPNQQKSTPILVPETLRGAHRLVTQTNSELQGLGTDSYGYINRPDNLSLNISTSKASLRRALLIMDAILKVLENFGHTVQAGPSVTILGATLRFSISENLKSKQEPDDDKGHGWLLPISLQPFQKKTIPFRQSDLNDQGRWNLLAEGMQVHMERHRKTQVGGAAQPIFSQPGRDSCENTAA